MTKIMLQSLIANNQLIEINEGGTQGYVRYADKAKTALPFDFLFVDENDNILGEIDIRPDGCYWRIQGKYRFFGTKIYKIELIKTEQVNTQTDASLTRPTT